MSDENVPEAPRMGRARASIGLIVGALALLGGVGLRALLFIGAPDVPRDDAVMFAALGLVIGAVFAAFFARPERDVFVDLGLWPIGAMLAVAMPVLALFDPSARPIFLPAGLEVAGAVALMVSFVRFQKAQAARRIRPSGPEPQYAVRLLREGQAKNPQVPAASLVPGDRFRAPMEEVLVVDGTIVSGAGFVDESALIGPSLPVAKKVGDYVFAGTRPSIPDLEVAVGAPQDDSLILQRDRYVESVGASLLETSGAGRVAAIWVLMLGAAAIGIVLWRAQATFGVPTTWLPGVAAVCVASAAAAPALSIVLGRIALLLEAKRAGLVVTRAKDVLALTKVRRWQIDPLLVAAPGDVEAAPFTDIGGDTIIAVAAALLDEQPTPERTSLRAAMRKKKLEALAGAALDEVEGVHRGTVNGRRWFLAPEAALEKMDGMAVDPTTRGTIDFLRERKPIVLLLANQSDGIVGAVGIAIAADVDAQTAARGLDASLMPGLPDTVRQAIAEAAGIPCDGPPVKGRDGTLLAEKTAPPSKGLRVRVASFRPGLRLEPGAPRTSVSTIANVPQVIERIEQIADASQWRAWVATIFPPALVAGLAFFGLLFPWAAALAGIATIVYAGRVPKATVAAVDSVETTGS